MDSSQITNALNKYITKLFMILFFGICIVPIAQAKSTGTIIYVDIDATGANNGTSWEDAYTDLQIALSVANSSDSIWVGEGTYYPGTNRLDTFQLKNGVSIYGGFAGWENYLDEREWLINSTILSGDIGTPNDKSDNSYHVVTGSGTDVSAILNGFIVQDGNASGIPPGDPYHTMSGGGMHNDHGSPLVMNTTIGGNSAKSGGGIYNLQSSPTFLNVTVISNTASLNGGGMFSTEYSDPILNEVTFSDNTAVDGGGMYNYVYSSPNMSNVTFKNNSVVYGGGGLYDKSESDFSLSGVSFVGNSATSGGGMYIDSYGLKIISNVSFIGNSATSGGGMYIDSYGIINLTNIAFKGNTATSGGGMYNDSSDPSLTNVIFSGNWAFSNGGGIYNYYSHPTMTNVTFSGNDADIEGGGMYNNWSSLIINNSILWGNNPNQMYFNSPPTINFSNVEGGCPSSATCDNLIDLNPMFVRNPDPGLDGAWGTLDDNYGDLHLRDKSPVIDSGNNSLLPLDISDLDNDGNTDETIPYDMDMLPRVINDIVDMGAYEGSTFLIFLPLIIKY